jgi:hypothetical protein
MRWIIRTEIEGDEGKSSERKVDGILPTWHNPRVRIHCCQN